MRDVSLCLCTTHLALSSLPSLLLRFASSAVFSSSMSILIPGSSSTHLFTLAGSSPSLFYLHSLSPSLSPLHYAPSASPYSLIYQSHFPHPPFPLGCLFCLFCLAIFPTRLCDAHRAGLSFIESLLLGFVLVVPCVRRLRLRPFTCLLYISFIPLHVYSVTTYPRLPQCDA